MTIVNNIITPSENKLLTNGETLSTKVYLSFLDSLDNWYEVDMDYTIETADGEIIKWEDDSREEGE